MKNRENFPKSIGSNIDKFTDQNPLENRDIDFSDPNNFEEIYSNNFFIDRSDYKVLSQQRDKDGNLMNMQKVSEKMVTGALELISKMDGSAVNEFGEENGIVYDEVVYLDKSARPVEWLVHRFWEKFSVEGVKRPHSSAVAIDRSDDLSRLGIRNIDGRDIETGKIIMPSDIDKHLKDPEVAKIWHDMKTELRALYVEGEIDPDGNIEKQIWNMPTRLDGKNVMIIDECQRSGSTLALAKKLYSEAFPDLNQENLTGEYLWKKDGVKMVNGEIEQGSVPVWYNSSNTKGRGIGERDEKYVDRLYEINPTQQNLRRKIGSFLLATPHHDLLVDGENIKYQKDNLARDLARDFKQLYKDMVEGRGLLVAPMTYGLDRIDRFYRVQGIVPKINEEGYDDWSDIQRFREFINKKAA